MDFGSWSPSHTILALFIVAGFIGQVGILFYRVGQTEKRLTRSEERAEKRDAELIAMIDKRMGEVNQRIGSLQSEMNHQIGEVNQRIGSLQSEMNQQGESLRSEMNQQIGGLRSEMNQRLSDMDASIRQLNQNHIEHLAYHQHNE